MTWLFATDRTAADSVGGATVTLMESGRELVESGDSVYWVTGRVNDSLPDRGELEQLQVRSFDAADATGPLDLLRMRRSLRRLLEELMTEVTIHAAVIHQPIAGQALGPLLRKSGIPSCYFFHGPWAPEYIAQHTQAGHATRAGAIVRRLVERRAVRSFEKVVVFSETMATLLRENHPAAVLPVRVTPGINLNRFRPVGDRSEARQRLGWPVTGPLILTVRRLVPRMGVDMLIEAFASIAGEFPGSRLLIGGDGPLRGDLDRLAGTLGMADRITFLDYIPFERLPAAFGAADLVAMPTRSLEGLGLVTLEAMACGTPVLATPVGGNVELLEPFRPELICDSVSVEGLAEGLRRTLTAGSESLHQLGLKARAHVEARYGWERTAADLRSVLGFD